MTEPNPIPHERLAEPVAIELPDPGWQLTCDDPGCAKPASWLLLCVKCCARSSRGFLFCDDDKRTLLALPLIACVKCGKTYAPPRAAFVSIEPLNNPGSK